MKKSEGKQLNVCIFTCEGHTFSFKNVTALVTNETVVSFNYKAMSDGLDKHAVFYVSRIVGWSKHWS